jgi:hypothetical protein
LQVPHMSPPIPRPAERFNTVTMPRPMTAI